VLKHAQNQVLRVAEKSVWLKDAAEDSVKQAQAEVDKFEEEPVVEEEPAAAEEEEPGESPSTYDARARRLDHFIMKQFPVCSILSREAAGLREVHASDALITAATKAAAAAVILLREAFFGFVRCFAAKESAEAAEGAAAYEAWRTRRVAELSLESAHELRDETVRQFRAEDADRPVADAHAPLDPEHERIKQQHVVVIAAHAATIAALEAVLETTPAAAEVTEIPHAAEWPAREAAAEHTRDAAIQDADESLRRVCQLAIEVAAMADSAPGFSEKQAEQKSADANAVASLTKRAQADAVLRFEQSCRTPDQLQGMERATLVYLDQILPQIKDALPSAFPLEDRLEYERSFNACDIGSRNLTQLGHPMAHARVKVAGSVGELWPELKKRGGGITDYADFTKHAQQNLPLACLGVTSASSIDLIIHDNTAREQSLSAINRLLEHMLVHRKFMIGHGGGHVASLADYQKWKRTPSGQACLEREAIYWRDVASTKARKSGKTPAKRPGKNVYSAVSLSELLYQLAFTAQWEFVSWT